MFEKIYIKRKFFKKNSWGSAILHTVQGSVYASMGYNEIIKDSVISSSVNALIAAAKK